MKQYEKAYKKLTDLLDNIEDVGSKSRYIRKYNLSLYDIHRLEDVKRNVRNGQSYYTINQHVYDLCKSFGFYTEERGIGYVIAME